MTLLQPKFYITNDTEYMQSVAIFTEFFLLTSAHISVGYNRYMEKIVLKQMVNQKNRTTVVVFFGLVLSAAYFISGSFYYGIPRFLPLSEFEMSIPFIIESIWIYVMLYPFMIWSIFSYKDVANYNSILYSMIVVVSISMLFFQLFPVGYPREFYPLPYDNTPSVNLFYKIRWADTAMNCFPSLHVSLCFLFSFGHWDENRKVFWGSLILSIIISISTLTTKQHYIADILSGFFISLVAYISIKKFTRIA